MKINSEKFNRRAERPISKNSKPSLARQEFKDECIFSKLIKRFEKTGRFYETLSFRDSPRLPEFLDCSAITDFESANRVVQRAKELFGRIPAEVRRVFKDSPQAFFAVMTNPNVRAEYVRRGLIPRSLVERVQAARPQSADAVSSNAKKSEETQQAQR